MGYTLVIDSQKDILFHITHHRIFDVTKCYREIYNALPCLDDLGVMLTDRKVDYIIGDQRTIGLISSYDKLYKPFNRNYTAVEEVSGSIKIYKSK